MSRIWLLKGARTAAGWHTLEADSKAEKADVILFDRDAWALVRADKAPTQYTGLTPVQPEDGLYISHSGQPCYIAGGVEVRDARAVLDALGDIGQEALNEAGDPDEALISLGRAY